MRPLPVNQKRISFSPLARTFLPALSLFLAGEFSIALGETKALGPDPGFLPPTFAKQTLPERALLLPDGKYLLFFDPDTLTDQAAGPITRFLSDGTLDTSFNFRGQYKNVNTVTPVGNGQFYVAATHYAYGFKDEEQILRVNADGSIDPTFTPATVGGNDPYPDVWQIIVQPDGKVLVAGIFLSFGGDNSRVGIVRLSTNGTLDPSLVPVSINGYVYAAALQSDGKVLISGVFSSVNGVNNLGVARLNANGSLDSGFQAAGFVRNTSTSRIRGIAVLGDGQILLSGALRTGSGVSARRYPIIRVSATGTFDATFDSSGVVSFLGTGRDFAIQPDGKVVIAVNSSVYRLNTNGSNDSSFRQPVIGDATLGGIPVTIQRYSDGHILVGGIFTDVDPPGTSNFAHFGVARLNSDGTLDSTLVSSHRTGSEVAPSSFARLSDGSTLVAFADEIDPPIAYNVARLLTNGSVDSSFTLSSSDPNRFLANGFKARGLKRLPDGNLFVYGLATDGTPVYGKVLPSGAEDTSFATNQGILFQKATVAPDGKIVGAAGTDAQITLFHSFARLLADGQTDLFGHSKISQAQVIRDPGNRLDSMYVGSHVLAVQPDGKMLVQYFAQDLLFHFVRLEANGAFDRTFTETSFTPTDVIRDFPVVFDPVRGETLQPLGGVWTASPSLLDAYIQSDGRIIVTGHFTTFGTTSARGIVRLQPDGSIDSTFNIGGGAQWTTTAETATFFPAVENIEPDAGKFLITGTFEAFDGTGAPGIAQLNADGSVDTSFVAPVQRDKRSRTASAFRGQPDGSYLLSGPYGFAGETTSRSLIRLLGLSPNVGNISTRLGVGTDENVLIEGFIVQGPAGSSKKLLVRAIGPSLEQFGIADALANPTLEIHDASGATVAANNDWQTTQIGGLITGNQFAEINGSGLAPGNDFESAIIASLEPGSYTAVVRGAGNTVGTGVVDAFDLSTGSAARLTNIATRGLVQPGDGLMIAGFIVQNGAVRAVVRAIGPSLVQFGISNALPDTTLELRDQQGAIVLENDDWGTSQQQELESLGLQPTHELEAALVATIQPGQYTAQVRGKGQASGIGVVQVYFVQ